MDWGCSGSRNWVWQLAEIVEQGLGLQESESNSLERCCAPRASERILLHRWQHRSSHKPVLQWLRLTEASCKAECDPDFFFFPSYIHFVHTPISYWMLQLPHKHFKLKMDGSSLLLLDATWFWCFSFVFRVLCMKSGYLYGSMSLDQARNKTSSENPFSVHALRQLGSRRNLWSLPLNSRYLGAKYRSTCLITGPVGKSSTFRLFWAVAWCPSRSDPERHNERRVGLSPLLSCSGFVDFCHPFSESALFPDWAVSAFLPFLGPFVRLSYAFLGGRGVGRIRILY